MRGKHMKIFISPAKTFTKYEMTSMIEPHFQKNAKQLMSRLKRMDAITLKKSMKLSDSLLKEVTSFNKGFGHQSYQALFTYGGQAFKQLNPISLSEDDIAYANDHLYILSGLYGILKPLDGISYYRLEMQDKTIMNLYDYWKPKLNDYLSSHDDLYINLASQEYSKVLPEHLNMITIDFIEQKQGIDLKQSMAIKTMRGLFARHLIMHRTEKLEDIKKIVIHDYHYDPSRSTDTYYLFKKEV
jgi:cytoplasmic iron level regulating protein YaaA (DUF328/UPF0246 family)